MSKAISVGQIVKSIAGRDADRYFLVRALDGDDFCLIVDGRMHKLSHPKRKRKKHLCPLDLFSESIKEKWLVGSKVFDSEIASALKQYNCKSKGETNGKE